MAQQGQDDPFAMVYLVVGILALFIGIGFLYTKNQANINFYIMTISWYELRGLSFLYEGVVYIYDLVGYTGYSNSDAQIVLYKFEWSNPGRYSFPQMMSLTGVIGSYLRYPIALYLSWLTYISLKKHSVTDGYIKRYKMMELVRNNVFAFPCMKPVAYRDILNEPIDEGPWMVARTPLQFCVENNLIVGENKAEIDKHVFINKITGLADIKSSVLRNGGNKYFHIDREKSKKVLINQLGLPFIGFYDLKDYEQGLVACFMCFIGGDKASGQTLLNSLSKSFKEGTMANDMTDYEIDIHNSHEVYEKYKDNEHVIHATKYHMSYDKTWIMGLLWAARGKGVLACSQFIWLRPTNRALWYALNQVGGSVAWAEGLAAWSHYKTEELAFMTIHDPEVEPAIDGLHHAIMLTGFIPNPDLQK